MIIWLQKFLHFSSFPFSCIFFYFIFFTTVWCKKWANPFGLDLRPALDHKPSVFSSRQELKGWLFKSHLMTQHSINNCIHTAISYNFIHDMIITFLLRCKMCHVPNTSSAVLALKIKSNTSKQKEIVVTYWHCEQNASYSSWKWGNWSENCFEAAYCFTL